MSIEDPSFEDIVAGLELGPTGIREYEEIFPLLFTAYRDVTTDLLEEFDELVGNPEWHASTITEMAQKRVEAKFAELGYLEEGDEIIASGDGHATIFRLTETEVEMLDEDVRLHGRIVKPVFMLFASNDHELINRWMEDPLLDPPTQWSLGLELEAVTVESEIGERPYYDSSYDECQVVLPLAFPEMKLQKRIHDTQLER